MKQLKIIKQQQAEIERLKKECAGLSGSECGLKANLKEREADLKFEYDTRIKAEAEIERLEKIEAEVVNASWWREWLEIKNQASQTSSGTTIKRKKEIGDLIDQEVYRSRKINNWWPINPVIQAGIVGEESGELMKAALNLIYANGRYEDFRKEAIQTAAMCIRLLEGS